MKQFLTLILLLTANITFAQSYTLDVTVTGIEKSNCDLYIGIYDSKKSMSDGNAINGGKVNVKNGSTTITASYDVQAGEYAIAIFLDENNNGKLDTNFLGIPSEDYGFSENTRMPSFNSAKFTVTEPKKITIKLI